MDLQLGYRRTMYNVWVIRDDNAPYWHTHNFLMGHIKFYGAMARPKVISELFRRGQKARSEKNQPKTSFFMMSEKENTWSEDETDPTFNNISVTEITLAFEDHHHQK
jgi:hypothetical protein